MGTFTVSTVMETVNVPIIGLAQARVSGRVSDPVQARMFLRAPEQDPKPIHWTRRPGVEPDESAGPEIGESRMRRNGPGAKPVSRRARP